MAWEVPITIDGLEYPVRFEGDSEPTQEEIQEAASRVRQEHDRTKPTGQGRFSSDVSQTLRPIAQIIPNVGVGATEFAEGWLRNLNPVGWAAQAGFEPAKKFVDTATKLPQFFRENVFEPAREFGEDITPINPLYERAPEAQALNTIGQATGQLATTLLPAKYLSLTPKAMTAMGLGQAWALGQQATEEQMTDLGVTDPNTRSLAGLLGGAVEMGSESIGGHGRTKFSKEVLGDLKSFLTGRGAIGRFAKTSAVEGFEEWPAGIGQRGIAQIFAPRDPENPDYSVTGIELPNPLDPGQMAQDFFYGTLGGAVFGTAQLLGSRSRIDQAVGHRMQAREAIRELEAKPELTPAEQADLEELKTQDQNISKWLERAGIEKIRPIVDKWVEDPEGFAALQAQENPQAAEFWNSPRGVAYAEQALQEYAGLIDAVETLEADPNADPEALQAARQSLENAELSPLNRFSASNQERAFKSYEEQRDKLIEQTKAAHRAAGEVPPAVQAMQKAASDPVQQIVQTVTQEIAPSVAQTAPATAAALQGIADQIAANPPQTGMAEVEQSIAQMQQQAPAVIQPKTDEQTAGETMASIMARTKPGAERQDAIAQRRAAAVRVADTLKPGDKVVHEDLGEITVVENLGEGKVIAEGFDTPIDVAGRMSPTAYRTAEGQEGEGPAATIVRAPNATQEAALPQQTAEAPSASETPVEKPSKQQSKEPAKSKEGAQKPRKRKRRTILRGLKPTKQEVGAAIASMGEVGDQIRVTTPEELADDPKYRDYWETSFQDSMGVAPTEEDWRKHVDQDLATAEGLSDDGTGMAVLFPQNIVVYNTDSARAKTTKTTPGIQAVQRVVLHENWHTVENWLATSKEPQVQELKERYLSMQDEVSDQTYDDLTEARYPEYSDWRKNPLSRARLFSEVMAERRERQNETGESDKLLDRFLKWLRDVINQITGRNPTKDELDDIFNAWLDYHRAQGKTSQRSAPLRSMPDVGGPQNYSTNDVAELVAQGSTLGQVVSLVAANQNSPWSELASSILETATPSDLQGKVVAKTPSWKEPRRSWYQPWDHTVAMGIGQEGNHRVVLHEALHALTSRKLDKSIGSEKKEGKEYLKSLKTSLSSNSTPQPVKDLISLYFDAVDALGLQEAVWEGAPGRTLKFNFRGDRWDYDPEKRLTFNAFSDESSQLKSFLKGKAQDSSEIKESSAGRGYGNDFAISKSLEKRLRDEGFLDAKNDLRFERTPREKPVANRPELAVKRGLPYGIGNLDEFMAEAFTSTAFQEKLNSIQSKGGKTLWQRFVDAIRKILGIPVNQGSLLEQVLATSKEVMALPVAKNFSETVRESPQLSKPDIQRVTPEQDAEYLAAVQRGDMATAQRMVDEAAKKTPFKKRLYHGTDAYTYTPAEYSKGSEEAKNNLKALAKRVGLSDWYGVTGTYERLAKNGQLGVTEDDVTNARRWQQEASSDVVRPATVNLEFSVFNPPSGELELGVHLGTEGQASVFGEAFPFFVDLGKSVRLPDMGTWNYQSVMRELRKRGVKISEEEYTSVFNASDNNEALRELLISKGVGSIVYKNEAEGEGDSYIVFSPSQIKSADPVTRDEQGNVIPLSQRFNSQSNDIRFSKPDIQTENDLEVSPRAVGEYYSEREARPKRLDSAALQTADQNFLAWVQELSGHPATSSPRPGNANALPSEEIANLMGMRVRYFAQPQEAIDDGKYYYGFYAPDSQTLWVNVQDAGESALKGLGHESIHHLRNVAPDLYQRLMALMSQSVRRPEFRAFLQKLGYEGNYSEEMLAHIAGDLATDRKFWTTVFDQNEAMGARILRALRSFLDWLNNALSNREMVETGYRTGAMRFMTSKQAVDKMREEIGAAYKELTKRAAQKSSTQEARAGRGSQQTQTQTNEDTTDQQTRGSRRVGTPAESPVGVLSRMLESTARSAGGSLKWVSAGGADYTTGTNYITPVVQEDGKLIFEASIVLPIGLAKLSDEKREAELSKIRQSIALQSSLGVGEQREATMLEMYNSIRDGAKKYKEVRNAVRSVLEVLEAKQLSDADLTKALTKLTKRVKANSQEIDAFMSVLLRMAVERRVNGQTSEEESGLFFGNRLWGMRVNATLDTFMDWALNGGLWSDLTKKEPTPRKTVEGKAPAKTRGPPKQRKGESGLEYLRRTAPKAKKPEGGAETVSRVLKSIGDEISDLTRLHEVWAEKYKQAVARVEQARTAQIAYQELAEEAKEAQRALSGIRNSAVRKVTQGIEEEPGWDNLVADIWRFNRNELSPLVSLKRPSQQVQGVGGIREIPQQKPDSKEDNLALNIAKRGRVNPDWFGGMSTSGTYQDDENLYYRVMDMRSDAAKRWIENKYGEDLGTLVLLPEEPTTADQPTERTFSERFQRLPVVRFFASKALRNAQDEQDTVDRLHKMLVKRGRAVAMGNRMSVGTIEDETPLYVGTNGLVVTPKKTYSLPQFSRPDLQAFHGTPHKVSSFSTERIGTGEGQQVYGWGLYFAENQKIAESYRLNVAAKHLTDKLLDVYDETSSVREATEDVLNDPSLTEQEIELLTAIKNDDFLGFDYPHQALREIVRNRNWREEFDSSPELDAALSKFGNVYTVGISATEDELLDWDARLSDQSETVQNAAKSLLGESYNPSSTGSQFYHTLQRSNYGSDEDLVVYQKARAESPRKTSLSLVASGLKGIKYLDRTSRGRGEGTRNFVIFQDSDIKITHVNGVESSPAGPQFSRPDVQIDEEYAEALSQNDIPQMQRLVDEEAQSKGWEPMLLYHYGRPGFTEFQSGVGNAADQGPAGTYLSPDPNRFQSFHRGGVYRVYSNIKNPASLETKLTPRLIREAEKYMGPQRLGVRENTEDGVEENQWERFLEQQREFVSRGKARLKKPSAEESPEPRKTSTPDIPLPGGAKFLDLGDVRDTKAQKEKLAKEVAAAEQLLNWENLDPDTELDIPLLTFLDRAYYGLPTMVWNGEYKGAHGSSRWAEQEGQGMTLDEKRELKENARTFLEAQGFDGVDKSGVMPSWSLYHGPVSDWSEVVSFRPNQLKSAEPITYDNDGKVIPPSERFNTTKTDIRFSKPDIQEDDSPLTDEEFQRDLEDVVAAIENIDATVPWNAPWAVRALERGMEKEEIEALWKRLQALKSRFLHVNEPIKAEGLKPTKATKDKRTLKSDNARVESYRRAFSERSQRAFAQEALEIAGTLQAGGMTPEFGKQVMAYLEREGRPLVGMPSNPLLRVRVAQYLQQNPELRARLGLDYEKVKEAIQEMGTASGRSLRSFASIYNPLAKIEKAAAELTKKTMAKEGVGTEVADELKDAVTGAQEETLRLISSDGTVLAEEARDSYENLRGMFAFRKAIESMEAWKRPLLWRLHDLLEEREMLLQQLERFRGTGAGSLASKPESSGPPMTLAQVEAALAKNEDEIGEILKQLFPENKKKRTRKEAVKEAKEEVEKLSKSESTPKEEKAIESFTDWVGGKESKGVDSFDELMKRFLNPNGFDRNSFRQALGTKFKNAPGEFLDAVADRVAGLINGNPAPPKTTSTTREPNYDARAKRAVAASLGAKKATGKKGDKMVQLVKDRMQGKITRQQLEDELKALGVEEETAYAMAQTVEQDIANRNAARTAKAMQKLAEKAVENRKKAIDRFVNGYKKSPKHQGPKHSRFVAKLVKAVDAGILDSQAVVDAFAAEWELHGLTEERMKEMAELLQEIEKLPDGQVKETLALRFNQLLNDLAPAASALTHAHNAQMGFVLSGLSTTAAQFSGLNRVLDPFGNSLQTVLKLPGNLWENLWTLWPRLYLDGWREMERTRGLFLTGFTGFKDGAGKGVGAMPTTVAASRPHQQSLGPMGWKDIRNYRQKPLPRFLRPLQPVWEATRYPAALASRAFNVIRASEGWVGGLDKNLNFKAIALTELMSRGMSAQEAWKKVNEALGESRTPMFLKAEEQAKEELAKGLIDKNGFRQRKVELVQDMLEKEWGLDLQNRHRQLAALQGFKQDPITPLGSAAYRFIHKILSKEDFGGVPNPTRMIFLFPRFFINALETAYMNLPILPGLPVKLMDVNPEKMDERQKRIVEIFGSLENYRNFRNAKTTSSMGMAAFFVTMLALALSRWDPDDDKSPMFYISGDVPDDWDKRQLLEQTGWWKPYTLYMGGIPLFNYVQSSPEKSMTLAVIGNYSDAYTFNKLLTQKYNQKTGEMETDAFKALGKPMATALFAPAARSTYNTWYEALSSLFNGKPNKFLKIIGQSAGSTVAGLSVGGLGFKDLDKASKMYDLTTGETKPPKASKTADQAFLSGVPFAHLGEGTTGVEMKTAFGEDVSPYSYFSMLSSPQEVSPEARNAAKLLIELGITKAGPNEEFVGGLYELSLDGKTYLFSADEREQVLADIGAEFARGLNRNAQKIRSKNPKDQRTEVNNIADDAKKTVLRRWRSKVQK